MTPEGKTKRPPRTPEYMAWRNMKSRCYSRSYPSPQHYRGRGVTVCARWRNSFAAFLADVGPRPSTQHSLDRHPDNNGNYRRGNVRWATQSEQKRNTRITRMVTHNGVTKPGIQWAQELGLSWITVRIRLDRGWSVARALGGQK